MTRNQLKIKLGVALTAMIASLAITAGAQALRPPEAGANKNSRVLHVKHARRVATISTGGRPVGSGVHVRSAPETRTE